MEHVSKTLIKLKNFGPERPLDYFEAFSYIIKEEEYVTESGKHALIMTRENVKGEKYDGKMVFMLEGSVLYNCIVNYDGDEEEKQAESLIKEWLEQF